VAGFAFGGPLGALLGTAAGHAYDRLRGRTTEEPFRRIGNSAGAAGRAAKQMAFSVGVIVLGAKMAKADGAVSRAEIDAFKQAFRVPPGEIGNVARIFDVAKRDARGFEPYARQIGLLFRHEPAVLEELLAGLFHVARADGAISAAELAYLRKVSDIFGLDAQVFERVRAPFAAPPQGPDPYAVLGVARSLSDDEIKKSYRQLIRENHPDTLVAKGMPQEFVDIANTRMAAINAAYDQVQKERGIK
jgi:DnaJ like chaperone protein